MLPVPYVPLGFKIHVLSQLSIILTACERAPAVTEAKCFVAITLHILEIIIISELYEKVMMKVKRGRENYGIVYKSNFGLLF